MDAALAPAAILAVGGLVVLCVGATLRRESSALLCALSLAAIAAAAAATIWGRGSTFLRPEALLDPSGFSRYFTLLFCCLTGGVLLFAQPYARRRDVAGDELYGLVLWACLGMVLTASAASWVTFFLGYELLSLCLYVLVALPRRGAVSSEAGLKYFFVGAVASAFLGFGIAVLYAAFGTLDIAGNVVSTSAASQVSTAAPWARLGFAFLLAGVAFKLALAPFHLWAPDVYQGAPAPVTALLAAGSKVALFAALSRVCLSADASLWALGSPTLAAFGALTVVVGNVGALTQPRAKRILAYSSVAQTGYLVLSLAAVRAGGAVPALFYAAVYAAMDLGAFGILGSLSSPGRDGDLDALTDLRGVGYTHPWRAAALVACLLSLAGLPPAAGFIGKVSIFVAVFRAGLTLSGVAALASTVAAAWLYLRIVIALYSKAEESAPAALPIPDAGLGERLGAGAVLVALLVLGVAPQPLLSALARILAVRG